MGSEKEGEQKRMLLSLAHSEQHHIRTAEACAHMAENSNNGSSSTITRIPQDQLFSILLLLPVEAILCFAMTCKKMKSLASSDGLWESICRRDWGHSSVDALKASTNYLQQQQVLSWNKLYQQVYKLDSVFCHRLLSYSSSYDDAMVPIPRASHSLNLLSGFLVLFGGGYEGGRDLDDTWIARAADDPRQPLTWQKTNSGTPSGRFGHSCVVIGDSLVLFGGINDLGARQNDTWIGRIAFNETLGITLSWQLLNVLNSTAPSPRGAHAGCCIDNRRMLIHGGIGPNGLRLADTWILDLSEDLSSGTWREIVINRRSNQPPPRSGHTLTYIGRSQTILFGGRGIGYGVLSDIWLLDESRGRFRWAQLAFEVENVPQGFSLPRVGHSANLIVGRRLLIYGGEDSNRHRKDDFWVLDVGSMPYVRIRPGNSNRNRSYRKLWKRLESKGDRPDCRSFHGACVDDSGCRLYVYGGMVDGITQPADSSGLRFNGESFLVELALQTQT